MEKKRIYVFDNTKFFLILLMVLGHALLLYDDEGGGAVELSLIRLIYLFHMPAFIFIAGYFGKKATATQIFTLLWQYFLFQTLYNFFAHFVLDTGRSLFMYTYPYWIMWFLLSLILWKLITPFVLQLPPAVGLAIAVALAVLSGFDYTTGYGLSFSRTLVYFPYFLLGALLSEQQVATIRKIPKSAAAFIFLFSFALLYFGPNLPKKLLFGSYSFKALEISYPVGVCARLLLLIWGFLLIFSLLSLVPDKRTIYSDMGQNTMTAYLLHGFVIQAIRYFTPEAWGTIPLARIGVYAFCILVGLLLMSRPVRRVMYPVLYPANWLLPLVQTRKRISPKEKGGSPE